MPRLLSYPVATKATEVSSVRGLSRVGDPATLGKVDYVAREIKPRKGSPVYISGLTAHSAWLPRWEPPCTEIGLPPQQPAPKRDKRAQEAPYFNLV